MLAMRRRIITKGNPHWGFPHSSCYDITAMTYEVVCLGQQSQFPWWHDELVNWHYQVGHRSTRTWSPELLSPSFFILYNLTYPSYLSILYNLTYPSYLSILYNLTCPSYHNLLSILPTQLPCSPYHILPYFLKH